MIRKRLFFGLALQCTILLLMFLAGCGGSDTTGSSTISSGDSSSSCSGQSSVAGKVQSTSSSAFILATQNAGNVQIAYSNMTLANRQVQGSLSDLQPGVLVKAAVTQNADKTYTASVIVVTGSFLSSPGSGGGLGGMNGGGPGSGPGVPSGNPSQPGTSGGIGGNSGSSGGLSGKSSCNSASEDPTNGHPTISGTIGSLSGKQLTILDASKQPVGTIMIASTTRFVKVNSVSTDVLRPGMKVSVTSTHGNDGKLTALALTILL